MSSTITSTTTTTAKEEPNVAAPPMRNPKDSMKSTWRTDKKQWTIYHWLMELVDIHPTNLNRPIPVHQKTDKMPYVSHFEHHKWILAHALWPLVVHQAYVSYTGKSVHAAIVILCYTLAYKINAIHELHMLKGMGHRYGFLDGDKHERDQVPDATVGSIIHSLIATATVRPMMSTFIAYRRASAPATISYWTPLEVGLYALILDFWFYWYHRCMHEYDFLWRFHRKHHLTKHPNPLLTLFADTEQEIFDIAIVPLMTYGTLKLMGFPMGFYDWWLCHQYIVMTELWGHSGVRVYATPATTMTPLLRYFDAELSTEDHDLHHRKGWKHAHNYGKQTFFWDRMFGTCHDRIEMKRENIDWNNSVPLKLVGSFYT